MQFYSFYRGLTLAVAIVAGLMLSSAALAGSVLPGDANADGEVGLLDLDILGQNFGMTSGATVADGDFNGDGAVALLDLDILGQNYGRTDDGGLADQPDNGDLPIVPLPASVFTGLAMLGSLGATYIVRHRKQSLK